MENFENMYDETEMIDDIAVTDKGSGVGTGVAMLIGAGLAVAVGAAVKLGKWTVKTIKTQRELRQSEEYVEGGFSEVTDGERNSK